MNPMPKLLGGADFKTVVQLAPLVSIDLIALGIASAHDPLNAATARRRN